MSRDGSEISFSMFNSYRVLKVLKGHYSLDTAYKTENHPFSGRNTCTKYFYIETREGLGQRLVTVTNDPFTGKMCKPKYSGWVDIMMIYLDENEKVQYRPLCMGWHPPIKYVKAYADLFKSGFDTQYHKDVIIDALANKNPNSNRIHLRCSKPDIWQDKLTDGRKEVEITMNLNPSLLRERKTDRILELGYPQLVLNLYEYR